MEMNEHPREAILELLILGSETLSVLDREAVRSHLDRCAGCRALAGQMTDFYDEVRTELENIGSSLPVLSPEELPPRGTGPSLYRRA